MTEAEWTTCTDPATMIAILRGKWSPRKVLLFSAACKRAGNWSRLPPDWRRCAELEELYADQKVSLDELVAAWRFRVGALPEDEIDPVNLAWGEAYEMAKDTGEWAVYDAKRDEDHDAVFEAAYAAAEARQCQLIREIGGSLFHPVALDPAWLTWSDRTVEKLARVVYEEERWDTLPILADALEEAGCTDARLLQHCREPASHVRGCWAIDLVRSVD